MAQEEIPLAASVDRQRVAVRLGDTDTSITIYYQPRQAIWLADMELPLGTPFVSGRILAPDIDLLEGLVHPLAGGVWCRPSGADVRALGRNPWGDTHRLLYEPP